MQINAIHRNKVCYNMSQGIRKWGKDVYKMKKGGNRHDLVYQEFTKAFKECL